MADEIRDDTIKYDGPQGYVAGAVQTVGSGLTVLLDEISRELFYVGEALPGSLTSDPVWRIKRVTQSGGQLTVMHAGRASFTQVWDDHRNLEYVA